MLHNSGEKKYLYIVQQIGQIDFKKQNSLAYIFISIHKCGNGDGGQWIKQPASRA